MRNAKSTSDWKNAKSGEVVLEAGSKITARTLRKLGEDGVKNIAFQPDELIGRFSALDMVNPETGEIYIEAGDELTADELLAAFHDHYLSHTRPYEIVSYTHMSANDHDTITAKLRVNGEEQEIVGNGNGPIAALVDAISTTFGINVRIRDYHEHTMAASADATAAAYIEADVDDEAFWGVGLHPSIVTASLRAVLNAVNRAIAAREAVATAAALFDNR